MSTSWYAIPRGEQDEHAACAWYGGKGRGLVWEEHAYLAPDQDLESEYGERKKVEELRKRAGAGA